MKSGNINFLEPSGPLQACNRTDLTLLWNMLIPKPVVLKFIYVSSYSIMHYIPYP